MLLVPLLALCLPLAAATQLTVAADFVTPPLDFVRGRKEVGCEVDWIKAVAQQMQCEVTFVRAPSDQCMTLLQEGKCDLVMGSITDAWEGVTLTEPFLRAKLVILTDKIKRPHILNVDDLHAARVGVLAKSVEMAWAQRMQQEGKIKDIVIYAANDRLNPFADLTIGDIDAWVVLDVIGKYLKFACGELSMFPIPTCEWGICFAVAEKQHLLRDEFNRAQQTLMAKGIDREIIKKWFVTTECAVVQTAPSSTH